MTTISIPSVLTALLAARMLAAPGIVSQDQGGAQNKPVVLRAESRVVQIDVVVKDKNGGAVADLRQSDFEIRDNGKPRPFQIFSFNGTTVTAPAVESSPGPAAHNPQLPSNVFRNTDAAAAVPPHSTILLLDYVNAWFDNAGMVRDQVLRMLPRLPADEPVAMYVLVRFQGLVVLQEYTTDRDLLMRKIREYIPPGMEPAPFGVENYSAALREAPGGPSGVPVPLQPTGLDKPALNGETAQERAYLLHQSSEMVRLSLKDMALHLAAVPGRKSVFWVTTGFPPREMRDMGQQAWDNTIHALNDANVAVNTVDSNLIGGPPRRWGGNGQVAGEKQLAERTGGKAYYFRNDIDNALLEGIRDSRQTYTLGFYLSDDERDGAFHRLEVRVDRPHLELHYRPGYFAGTNPQLQTARKSDEMESILLSPVDGSDVVISASVNRRGDSVELGVKLDTRTLSLNRQTAGWSGEVKEMFVETDAAGNQLAKISDTKKFQIPDTLRESCDRDGVPMPSTVPYIAGAEKLAIIIRDTATGRTGLLKVPLSFPPR